jgi:hypothetical protein
MKVIHVIKKIEAIDEDIKELRKLEKSLARDKSFSTPIYISIEKQINIMLGDRIKLLDLKISNPPAELLKDVEDAEEDDDKNAKPAAKKARPKREKPASRKNEISREADEDISDIEDIGMLTQDLIDERFARLKQEKEINDKKLAEEDEKDESIKLLDVALENGSLNKDSIDKERKKVRFFKDNFPGGEY